MRLLVTGAGGFTGKHFEIAAKRAGHDVVSLCADLTDPTALKAELSTCDGPYAVVHLAAISFIGHSNDSDFYAVNTVGTVNLLSALATLPKAKQPTKVLVASSANIYGNCEISPISESQPPAPVNHYAASKLAMEHLASTFSQSLPVVIARPFNYTGPGQAPTFLIPKLVDHFARRASEIELGNLHVEREFNDVRMVCEVYLRLLTDGAIGETYNVCSGKPHSLHSVINQLTELTGHSMKVTVNPDFVRKNEVHRLCGDPARLIDCLGELPEYSLQDTLRSMLPELNNS